MFKVLSDQRNANQNDSKIPSYTNQNGSDQNLRLQHMLVRMWRKRNTSPLLVGLQTGTTTLEINLEVPQKIGTRSTWRPSYSTLGNIPKRGPTMPLGHVFHYVHRGLVCDKKSYFLNCFIYLLRTKIFSKLNCFPNPQFNAYMC